MPGLLRLDESQPLVANRQRLRVVETDCVQDRRWADFVEAHPDGLIYHHPEWLSALRSEYHQRCLNLMCLDEDNRAQGVLPLFYTRGFPIRLGTGDTGRRLSSLPRTPVGGPLAKDQQSTVMLVEAAMNIVRQDPGLCLELKTSTEGLEQWVPGLVAVPWRFTYVNELLSLGSVTDSVAERSRTRRDCLCSSECPQLRFGNARRQHRATWGARHARKVGLDVRLANSSIDVRRWYALYLETMRKVAVPPRAYRLFAELAQTSGSTDHFKLLLAERQEGTQRRIIAGSILLMFGQTAFYAFTGCAEGDIRLHAHDLLQLEAIRLACKGGFRWYDFGEVAEEHPSLAQFKSKWGASSKRLYRYYFPAPRDEHGFGSSFVGPARSLWRVLPKPLTAVLGDLLYRFL